MKPWFPVALKNGIESPNFAQNCGPKMVLTSEPVCLQVAVVRLRAARIGGVARARPRSGRRSSRSGPSRPPGGCPLPPASCPPRRSRPAPRTRTGAGAPAGSWRAERDGRVRTEQVDHGRRGPELDAVAVARGRREPVHRGAPLILGHAVDRDARPGRRHGMRRAGLDALAPVTSPARWCASGPWPSSRWRRFRRCRSDTGSASAPGHVRDRGRRHSQAARAERSL